MASLVKGLAGVQEGCVPPPNLQPQHTRCHWGRQERIQLTLCLLSSPFDGLTSAHLLEENKKVRPQCIKNYDGSAK